MPATGNAVLEIWNERVNIAKNTYEPLRTCVLVRNFNAMEFTILEYETTRFDPSGFEWRLNKEANVEGFDKAQVNKGLHGRKADGSLQYIVKVNDICHRL